MKLYEDDIANNGGPYESVKVIRLWNRADDVYELEEDPAAEGCESYRIITAERILYRRRIKDLPVQEAFLERQAILDQPLVSGGPTLSELLSPEVHVAMTFVPLAGLHGATSCLGRLYCISGLSFHACPFENGVPAESGAYGWMLLGVPEEIRRTGESWNLAANLLMAALGAPNAQPLIRELSTRIVTGRVNSSGHVFRIDELQGKIRFVTSNKWLRQLKWMVPHENREEAVMINADMPETMEEALKLIESNRSRATDALVSAISSESLDNTVITAQLFNGADVSVEDPVSHENLVQTLKRRTLERLHGTLLDKDSNSDVADKIRRVFDECVGTQRILSYYADLPQMFFTLARRRADEAIEAMLKCYGEDAINATDSDGETALDFALENDPSVAGILRKHGATVRGIYRAGSRKMREMLIKGAGDFSDEVYKYFLNAVESGFLDVNAMIDFGPEGLSTAVSLRERDILSTDLMTTVTVCRRRKTNIFLESILFDMTGELVKKCIERGANVNVSIDFSRDKEADWDYDDEGFPRGFKGFRDAQVIMRNPLALAEAISRRIDIEKLLRESGAQYRALRYA